MQKTTFKIAKMDCPSEEQLVRMKLDGIVDIQSMEFDIPNRLLHVAHNNENDPIFQKLNELKLDTSIVSTVDAGDFISENQQSSQRKVLWAVLLINFSFFAIEMITGLISYSMGLVADSLDMLADSIVYGLALFAVGGTLMLKKRIAKIAGYMQIFLALLGFLEVIRRFVVVEQMPEFRTMIVVSVLALFANVVCLYLLQRNKSKEAHMQASMIFTSNDIIINVGVITAAVFVNWLKTGFPDLIIGAIVFVLVARGAYRILHLSK